MFHSTFSFETKLMGSMIYLKVSTFYTMPFWLLMCIALYVIIISLEQKTNNWKLCHSGDEKIIYLKEQKKENCFRKWEESSSATNDTDLNIYLLDHLKKVTGSCLPSPQPPPQNTHINKFWPKYSKTYIYFCVYICEIVYPSYKSED